MKLEVRIHGRGGQGVVTAAELLSLAAFDQGLHAQALPSFGSERTGAPVVSFCRIAGRPIRAHDPVSHPDVVVVQDPTLLHDGAILTGLTPEGLVVVNTGRSPDQLVHAGLALAPGQCAVCLPATELSREALGRPLPNTALVGAVVALTHVVELHALQAAIRERFGHAPDEVLAANLRLASDAYVLVREQERHRA
ncbi:MAG TPA: 2-oxoacid:acceptor oxidoreductase family protein [Nocardioides sp.]|uniref:2-oxoacid:acceptor oxidoreductase family protein n=1 Tax=uncultured Nocardioides sp. TaxID=198441 RepID=UPI000EE1949F|nr:2-oxoacid:acceptor oxidoreductase family protein [uncultured Nocardioides sp.]HCB06701.1 2-oxoacid:acceptor oxidoreductase [Nocardioides sp.]HRD59835.1 2-oxoacid:acceptor oxidoreductase family protein [Nocardioides sp.]HRI95176.1 2-oxoacid:acceptor oxidoreductase family protein [Nocardioides sp.]HRK47933.1 2-oxoacid:acceptor oxidoreductase family protein [Nocardioides sp.]